MQDSGAVRSMIIRRVIILAAIVLVFKVAAIQLIDRSYSQRADARTLYNKPLYPSRGLILDRNQNVLAYNNPVYSIEVTENQLQKDLEVQRFCELLRIDTLTYYQAMQKLRSDRHHSPGLPATFLQNLPPSQFAPLQENLHEFGGVSYVLRNVRGYPNPIAPHVLGYISEVDQQTIDASNQYIRGDYIGTTGIERTYEKWLKGQKGVSYVLKDNIGREVGRMGGGILDSAAISGTDVITTLDLDLQVYGETLMKNKKGSIVCIEPSTGEILAMVSAPSYDPNLLTIHQGRSAAFSSLQQDSLNPLFDRSIMAAYPPGSIFKPILALIAMQEGVLYPNRTIYCNNGYHYKQLTVGCHSHPTATDVSSALQHSCNAYFVQVFRDLIEQEGFSNPGRGLEKMNSYLSDFGLGSPLGIDLPQEKSGNIPSRQYYDSKYGTGVWRSTYLVSLGIGQGELALTTVQMANLAAIIANRGEYYTPHLLKAVSGQLAEPIPPFVQHKHVPIDKEFFGPVINGMERAVSAGTATSAYLSSIPICGKTGTSQNPRGLDHSVFYAFAPKDNPQIAIAVYVENAGWGGTYAAPIASLMIEKYINGEIAPARKWVETRILNADLIVNP